MVCCVWEPPPGNSSHGNNLKQFLLGQVKGDKASYSPSPCFHLPNSPPCSPGPRIHGEHKQGVLLILDRSLRHSYLYGGCIMIKVYPHHSSLHWWVARRPQKHERVSSNNLLCLALRPHSAHHALLSSHSVVRRRTALHSIILCNP